MRSFGIKRELNPTKGQIQRLQQSVGACRAAQNFLLEEVKRKLESGESQSWTSISLHASWRVIRSTVAPWYVSVSKECFQYGAERLSIGLKNFIDSKKGKRKGKPVGFPDFRKRGVNDSVKFTAAKIAAPLLVHLPRIGKVKLKEEVGLIDGQRLTAITVARRADKWFATFHIREDGWKEPVKATIKAVVGVDLGIGDRIATLSDGEVIENPRFLRSRERQLKKISEVLSRKAKGSKNRKKVKAKLSRLHYRIATAREDFIHKFTSNLVKNHDEIVIEDLAVAEMAQSLNLGKSVMDAANAEIRRQLEYKCLWYGKTLTIVNRFFPSSKLCSTCGLKNTELTLSQRYWTCKCGAPHDRDYNAALNLAASSAVLTTP
jgi:putative transposase